MEGKVQVRLSAGSKFGSPVGVRSCPTEGNIQGFDIFSWTSALTKNSLLGMERPAWNFEDDPDAHSELEAFFHENNGEDKTVLTKSRKIGSRRSSLEARAGAAWRKINPNTDDDGVCLTSCQGELRRGGSRSPAACLNSQEPDLCLSASLFFAAHRSSFLTLLHF